MQSLLRLVTSIELLHIECVLLYPVSQKSVSTKWRVYKGKIWTPDTSPSTHSISTNSMVTSHAFRTSGKYQAWNDDQFTEPFSTEIFIWECWKLCFRASRSQKFRGTHYIVFSGFALGWPLCGQKSQRGTVQRLDTLKCSFNMLVGAMNQQNHHTSLGQSWCIDGTRPIYATDKKSEKCDCSCMIGW